MDILEIASMLARTAYTKEFCSICGKVIAIEEVNKETKKDKSHLCLLHQQFASTTLTAKTLSYNNKKIR